MRHHWEDIWVEMMMSDLGKSMENLDQAKKVVEGGIFVLALIYTYGE